MANRYDEYPALARAVREAGGLTALAQKLGLKRASNVSNWLDAKRVPARWCGPVQEATGVPKEELRPDLYKPAPTCSVCLSAQSATQ